MVYWILHHAHLKEVDLTQNWVTMNLKSSQPYTNLLSRRAHMNRLVMK